MKKIFVVLLMVMAGTLYAEISLGVIVDMAITPYQLIINDDDTPRRPGEPELEEIIMGAGAGRFASGQGVRARLDFRASHEDIIGTRVRIQARTDGVAIEDYLQAWWKPTSWLRIDAGRFFDDRFRGKINDLDERMTGYTVRMYDADAIFTRFRTHWSGQAGLMVGLTPIDNLWVGALLYDLNPFSASSAPGTVFDAHPDYVRDNSDVYNRIQAAAGYTIPGVGLFRVQYFGAKPHVNIRVVTDETAVLPSTYRIELFNITAPRVEAAFAFTGVDNLTLDIGGKVPLPFRDWTNSPTNIFEKEDEALLDALYKIYKDNHIWQAPYQASLGLRYKLSDLELTGRVDTKFLGSIKGHNMERHLPTEMNVHLWPSYTFNSNKIIVNFGYEYIGPTYDQNKELIGSGYPRALNGGNRYGIGLSVQRNFFGSSFVKGGVAYKFASEVNGVQERAVLSVPLFLEFSF